MYINPNPAATTGMNISGQISADMNLPALSEGDTIAARVIFSGEGAAHLKTADGALIRARLEGGVILPEGSEVLLTVEEKNADSITLRIAEFSGGQTSAAARPALSPALAAIFEQIQASGLPAAQKLELFTKAVADFPSLSPRHAAVQEALAALSAPGSAQAAGVSGPNGLGQMLAELAALLSRMENPAAAGRPTALVNNPPAGEAAPKVTVNISPLPGAITAPAAAPATGNAAANSAVVNPMAETAASPTAQAANTSAQVTAPPTGADTNTATPNTATAIPAPATASPPVQGNAAAAAAQAADNTAQATAHPTGANTNTAAPHTATAIPAPAAANPPAQGNATPAAAPNPAQDAVLGTQEPAALTAAAKAGAEITPPVAAQQREALQTARQIAGELYAPEQNGPKAKVLAQFIERLFARIGSGAEQGGAELQKCARELEMRLNLLKEAISRSSLPQREELLSQTNRILQQTEALRESRLLCLQLPIQFEQQRQTAELYVYRRERRGRPGLDPQNATILLALNTEHLGRLQALIQTRGKEINLKLEISRADAVPFVREHSQALAALLKEAGFKLNSSSVEQLKRETTGPREAENALREYQRNFDGKLDFFI